MKISAIKTAIRKPARRILPYAIGALALTSCTNRETQIIGYCNLTNRNAKEYLESIDKKVYRAGAQAVLDSLVYRDLFNSSMLAKDSSAITEFNNISTTYRYNSASPAKIDEFNKKIASSGLSPDNCKQITLKLLPENRQFVADKFLFKKFFTEKGVMNEDFASKFERISAFLNPFSILIPKNIAEDVKSNKQ